MPNTSIRASNGASRCRLITRQNVWATLGLLTAEKAEDHFLAAWAVDVLMTMGMEHLSLDGSPTLSPIQGLFQEGNASFSACIGVPLWMCMKTLVNGQNSRHGSCWLAMVGAVALSDGDVATARSIC